MPVICRLFGAHQKPSCQKFENDRHFCWRRSFSGFSVLTPPPAPASAGKAESTLTLETHSCQRHLCLCVLVMFCFFFLEHTSALPLGAVAPPSPVALGDPQSRSLAFNFRPLAPLISLSVGPLRVSLFFLKVSPPAPSRLAGWLHFGFVRLWFGFGRLCPTFFGFTTIVWLYFDFVQLYFDFTLTLL